MRYRSSSSSGGGGPNPACISPPSFLALSTPPILGKHALSTQTSKAHITVPSPPSAIPCSLSASDTAIEFQHRRTSDPGLRRQEKDQTESLQLFSTRSLVQEETPPSQISGTFRVSPTRVPPASFPDDLARSLPLPLSLSSSSSLLPPLTHTVTFAPRLVPLPFFPLYRFTQSTLIVNTPP